MEKCPREESFADIFPLLGDKEAQDEFRAQNDDKHHCNWLKRDPDACECLPAGIDGTTPGQVCPYNVYATHPEVFQHREAVIDSIERIFRLVNASHCGVLGESLLDPLSMTELLTARGELDRQQNERMKREHEKARLEAESNRGVINQMPQFDESGVWKTDV